jgi:predicted deacylase
MLSRSRTHHVSLTLLFCLLCFLHSATIAAAYYPDYQTYHNLQSIGDELISLARDFPGLVELRNIGSSRANRPITAASLFHTQAALSRHCPPPTVILTSGEHAREFIPVEALLALMRNLTKLSATDSTGHADILRRVRVVAVPMVNPDGRALLEQTNDWCCRGMPNGVDINRNFPWQFGGAGSSGDVLNEEYRGPAPLSEPESRALASIFNASLPAAALATLHSGSQVIYTPFSDTESKNTRRLPPDSSVAVALAADMAAQCGAFYTETGVVYEKNDYTADGTLSDWASAVMHVPLVFTFEMYGDPKAGDLSNCFQQFNPESTRLSECVQLQLPALLFLLRHVARNAEHECERRSFKETSALHASFQGSAEATAATQAQARPNGSAPSKDDILHEAHVLSQELHDAQAALQRARLKLIASLRARGVYQ